MGIDKSLPPMPKDRIEKPLLDVLSGNSRRPPPIWLMRQAGRYLPEYKTVRARAADFLDLCYNPEIVCEITLQPIERFALDAAIIFSDILVVPHALGQEVSFVEGEGPKLKPIEEEGDLLNLDLSKIDEHLCSVYEGIILVGKNLSSNVSLVGFSGGPWTVAAYMIEGGSSRDFQSVRKWAYGAPDNFEKLIDILVEATSIHLCNQISAGAEAVQIFDSWASLLTVEGFQRWVIEPTAKIVQRIREEHSAIPIIGFPRGAGLGYEDYVRKTGVTAVSVDSSISLEWMANVLPPQIPVQGNLDSVMLLLGGQPMFDATKQVLQQIDGRPFIFNLGHGVIKETPPEHVFELVRYIRENFV